ncbi:MAG: hypothetical protein IJ153_00670 [Clostridia bacterium]|nr:hypothetical protein [Clostridia bacterium]
MESNNQKSNKDSSSNYLMINGERITVSHEVYQMIRKENNHIRYSARSEYRCAQKSFSACQGDCQNCRYRTNGRFWTEDEFNAERILSMAAECNVEAEVLSAITMERVYAAAEQRVQYGGRMLRMRFEDNLSNREIAEILGVSHTIINRRMAYLISYFKASSKLFF